MTYATLMVHLELGRPNPGILRIAGDLAERFHAGVVGIAACQPMRIIYGDGSIPGEIIEQDRDELEAEIAAAEKEFHDALKARVSHLEWRSTVRFESLSDYLAEEARSADLLITGVDRTASLFDRSHHVEIGDLVMQIGRPVLVVPSTATHVGLDRVVVGWKESGETRRAISDAVPMLQAAAEVTVVEFAAEDELPAAHAHLPDVLAWLRHHGVEAKSMALTSDGDDADALDTFVRDQRADLVVAGAYGHSRLREWVLGGVTRDLLLRADWCSLVSH